MVRKDSPYQSYRDLKGKKMGILGPATTQYQMVQVLTRLEGLNLEKDFQLVVGAVPVQIGWLLKGEVEAIHTFEPSTTQLLVSDGDKVRELYWLNDFSKKLTGRSWILGGPYTSDGWVKKSPDLAKQVSLAFNDTTTYIFGHDQVWKGDLAKKQWKIDDPKVLERLSENATSQAILSFPAQAGNPVFNPIFGNLDSRSGRE